MASVTADAYNEHMRQRVQGRLLDLVCGKVPFYEFYRDLVSEVVCVDWPGSAHGNQHVDTVANLTIPLPLEDESCDTILASRVLEHLPEPAVFWSEVSRIIRPGGRIIMTVPFLDRIHESPHDYCRHTDFALRRGAENCGLEVELLEPLGGAPVVICDNVAKVAVQAGGLGELAAIAMQGSCEWFRRTSLGGLVVRKTAIVQPSNCFLILRKPTAATEHERDISGN